jgi:hypothetical protein
MEIEWRTIQFFLDEEFEWSPADNESYKANPDAPDPKSSGVISEVSVDAMNSQKMRCTCERFSKLGRCKHTKYLKEQLAKTEGVFNLSIPEDVEEEDALDALGDTDLFRDLVLRYGKVETL